MRKIQDEIRYDGSVVNPWVAWGGQACNHMSSCQTTQYRLQNNATDIEGHIVDVEGKNASTMFAMAVLEDL